MIKETNSKKILKTNFFREKKEKRKTYKKEEKNLKIYSKKKKENFTKDINIYAFVDDIKNIWKFNNLTNNKYNNSIAKRQNDVTMKNVNFVYDKKPNNYTSNKRKKFNLFKNKMFYANILQNLFIILFFIFQFVVKSEADSESSFRINDVININIRITSKKGENYIIKLNINQTGFHRIYNKKASYFSSVKINNDTNAQYLEEGVYYLPYNYNVVELHVNPQEKDLSNLFYSCSNITKIDFSDFDFSYFETMEGLFYGCSSLTSIEFGNIKSENVKNMSWMFNDCISLKTLDLNNFDTSKVIDMRWMFHNCSSLEFLDLSNFNTKSLENMEAMFYGVIKLDSLYLLNFNTSKVTTFKRAFSKCESLESLNLNSFHTNNDIDMSYMFDGCKNLKSIDFLNLNISENSIIDNMLNNTSKNLIIHINSSDTLSKFISKYNFQENCSEKGSSYNPEKEKICSYNFYYEENSNKYLCTNYYNLSIYGNSLTLNHEISCNLTSTYSVENTFIVEKCPENFESSNDREGEQFYCIPNCPREKPFLLIYQAECSYNCSISERQNRKCITYYQKGNFNAFDIIINQTRDELIYNFDKSVVNGNKINEKNINISILSIDLKEVNLEKKTNNNLKKRELSEIDDYYINLQQCIKNLLNNGDNSLENENLYLLRVDVDQDGMKYPNFFYELYQSSYCMSKLNLQNCEGIKTIIEIYNQNLKKNFDKYNLSSGFYDDICYTTKSKYNTDIILKRRQLNYVEYNLSVCGLNCEFIQYNRENGQAICSCDVKTEIPFLKDIRFDKYALLKSFTEINNLMNVKMLKCYKTIFNKRNIIKNIGFFVFIFLIILNVVCIILFYRKDYKKLIDQIKNMKSDNNSINNTSSNKKNSKNYKTKKIRKKKQKNNILNSSKSTEKNIMRTINKLENKNKGKDLKKYKPKLKKKTYLNHSELNSLKFHEALNQDKRSYIQYYISLLQTEHLLLYIFYSHDYNSKMIKISMFIFTFSSDIAINALFFSDSTMDKIYINHGLYNFIYQIPKIIYSSLISSVLNFLIKFLGLSQPDILKIKNENIKKEINIIKTLKMKFLFFFIIDFLFLIIFWYYVTCFCGVYNNTQIFLFKDSLIGFCVSLITPLLIYLIPGGFRICSIKIKNEYCYNISNILQLL